MSVITVDFFKGKVPIRVGANPVDVKNNALVLLDGFKAINIMPETTEINQNSINLSSSAQQAERAREMNAEAQNTYGSGVINTPLMSVQPQDNMTVAAMEVTPVNATSNNIINNDKLEILRLQKALATANTEISRGIDSFDKAQQIIQFALQDKQQYENDIPLSKAV